jgi:hypothetical protein
MPAPTPEDGRPVPPALPKMPPRTQFAHSVVTSPLTDPHARARIGIPTGDNETIPIVIELNRARPDGVDGAYESFVEIWPESMPGPIPEPFEEYLRVLLTMTQVRSLVRADQDRTLTDRAIHRIWPDFPADILDAVDLDRD